MHRVRTLTGMIWGLGLGLGGGAMGAGGPALTPLVRLLPPSADAAASSAEIPAKQEPRLDHRKLLALLHKRVKYVFVLFQENRSFDFCYGSFPGVDGLYSGPGDPRPGFTQNLDNT